MVSSILDLLNVPRELTLEFLATFARFEFALKKAGYAQGDDSKSLAVTEAIVISMYDWCSLQKLPSY